MGGVKELLTTARREQRTAHREKKGKLKVASPLATSVYLCVDARRVDCVYKSTHEIDRRTSSKPCSPMVGDRSPRRAATFSSSTQASRAAWQFLTQNGMSPSERSKASRSSPAWNWN